MSHTEGSVEAVYPAQQHEQHGGADFEYPLNTHHATQPQYNNGMMNDGTMHHSQMHHHEPTHDEGKKKKGIGKLWKSVKKAVSDVGPKSSAGQPKQQSLSKSRGRSGVMTMQQMLERDAELRAEHQMAVSSGYDASPDFGVWLAKKQGRPAPGTSYMSVLPEELGTPRDIPTPRGFATPRQPQQPIYKQPRPYATPGAGTPPNRYLAPTPPEIDTSSAQYSTTPPTQLSASSQPYSRTPPYGHQESQEGTLNDEHYMHPIVDDEAHKFAPPSSRLHFQPQHLDDATHQDLYTDEDDEALSL